MPATDDDTYLRQLSVSLQEGLKNRPDVIEIPDEVLVYLSELGMLFASFYQSRQEQGDLALLPVFLLRQFLWDKNVYLSLIKLLQCFDTFVKRTNYYKDRKKYAVTGAVALPQSTLMIVRQEAKDEKD